MIDAYTKAVPTVIALALVALVVERYTGPALALGDGCGSTIVDPCYIQTAPGKSINVFVTRF